MKTRIRTMFAVVLATIGISLLITNIAVAKDLQAYRKEGIRAMKAGRHQEGLRVWKEGLKLAEEEENEKMQGSFLTNIGLAYRIMGQYEKSLEYCQKSLGILRKIGDFKGEGIALTNIGLVYGKLGQYQEALSYFQKSLAIAKKCRDVQSEGNSLGNIGSVYDNLGQYGKALSYYQKALAIHTKIGDVKGEGSGLGNIANIYKNLGRYEEALEHYLKALAIFRTIGDIKREQTVIKSISVVYINLAQHKKALEYCKESLVIDRKLGDLEGEGQVLNNIGLVYDVLGQYEKALSYYHKALALHIKIGDVKGEGTILGNIGIVYQQLGQYQKSLSYHHKALAIKRKIGDVIGEGSILGNIGIVYRTLGQYQKSLSYYQKALAIERKIGDVKGEGTILGNIGIVYQQLGQYQKSLSYHHKALAIKRKIGDVIDEGSILGNIGIVYQQLGQYQKSLSYHHKALTIKRKIGYVKGEGSSLYNMGYTILCGGKLVKAEIYLEFAIEAWESIRGQVKTGKERTSFQFTLPDVYGSLAAARLAQGDQPGAFEAVERGRAKSFLDLLGTHGTGAQRSREKTEKIDKIERQLVGLREKNLELASAPVGVKTRSAYKALGQKISNLDKQRLELIDQLRRSDPELGSLVVVDPPTLKEIQALFPPGAALVEYFHPGEHIVSGKKQDNLWIFVVHASGLHFEAVDVSKSDLKKGLEKYAKLVADESSNPQSFETVGAKLYKWLVEPIEPILQLTDSETLVIVPWGPMFKIPFAALAPKGGKPLGAKKNIVMAPSAGVYRYLVKKRASGRKNILAIGNPKTAMTPLPGAEKEVKEIAGLFGRSAIYTRAKATEALIKKDYVELGRPDVIHLACHGIFNEKAPQLSHLALTPDQNNDGNLEMHELFDLDWRGVSLVTMSACSSGKGKLGAGDDLVGLTRGFMFAGAPSILCSLWDVDDEATRTLMVSFYKNYLSGMSKPEALRKAQLAMQKTKKWSHPYYWSAFVLFGDWE